MLIDPFTLGHVPPSAIVETKQFSVTVVDAAGVKKEVSFSLTLRGLDSADDYVVQDTAFAYARMYAPTDGTPPSKTVLFGSGASARAIPMSFQLCNAVCTILVAQEGGERYTFDQLCVWMLLLGPNWADVIKWSDELSSRAKNAGKA